jgi:two-component system, OmpR family, alkaline phosphatase synthesis response regulator PhoP
LAKILLVDDEVDILETVGFWLKSKGYDLITAADGNEALNKARKERPDLIVLDLMLPKIDGYKVCRLLKFDEKYKHIPIIMFTARVREADRQLGLETGADAYITKPFEPAMLLRKIEELLEKTYKKNKAG